MIELPKYSTNAGNRIQHRCSSTVDEWVEATPKICLNVKEFLGFDVPARASWATAASGLSVEDIPLTVYTSY